LKEQQDKYFVNHLIRMPKILCIDQNNKNLGIISTSEALQLAKNANLDLLQISPPTKDKPATCKILDFGKYKYELSKKQKEAQRKSRENEIRFKEVQFRPNTNWHDLEIKAEQTKKFLGEGYRVKIVIVHKGREVDHAVGSYQLLESFLGILPAHKVLEKPSRVSISTRDMITIIEAGEEK
jgi:translation initiation factor IF-3